MRGRTMVKGGSMSVKKRKKCGKVEKKGGRSEVLLASRVRGKRELWEEN